MSQAFKMNPQYEREGSDDYIVIAVCSASLDTTSHNNFDHFDRHENMVWVRSLMDVFGAASTLIVVHNQSV